MVGRNRDVPAVNLQRDAPTVSRSSFPPLFTVMFTNKTRRVMQFCCVSDSFKTIEISGFSAYFGGNDLNVKFKNNK